MNVAGQRGSKVVEIIGVLQSRGLKKWRDALTENKNSDRKASKRLGMLKSIRFRGSSSTSKGTAGSPCKGEATEHSPAAEAQGSARSGSGSSSSRTPCHKDSQHLHPPSPLPSTKPLSLKQASQ